uniref:Uncharacterized protein n=1 Tax=Kuenenia stuttgartiensis TaxID=174633 RepID=Q1PYA9_KUEST|nr:unknown protein [Candidatus Kuenenia stuttgartiensis]
MNGSRFLKINCGRLYIYLYFSNSIPRPFSFFIIGFQKRDAESFPCAAKAC